MQTIDFQDIAKLLNYSRTTSIDLSPIQAKEGRWAIYKGAHKIHTSSLPFRVLYLYAAATQEDIRAAVRALGNPADTHVVYPPSLDRNIRTNTEIAFDAQESTRDLDDERIPRFFHQGRNTDVPKKAGRPSAARLYRSTRGNAVRISQKDS